MVFASYGLNHWVVLTSKTFWIIILKYPKRFGEFMVTTIHDVARRLNLSITTVSRALDGYADVAEETRRRVVEVARELGYTPNRAARQLRRRRSDSIGYVQPTSSPRFTDPFFSEFIAGLADETTAQNLDLLVSNAPPSTNVECQVYERLIHGRKVDGLVLNRMRLSDWRVQYLSQVRFPFVTQERSLDALDYTSVEVDGRFWFKTLVNHLISLGHHRIAYVGASPELKIQADRLQGYQEALHQAGLDIEISRIIEGDLTAEGGFRAGTQLLGLPEPPTAIACVDDMTAIGVMHAAHEYGLVVGQDLAVVGFDGIVGFEHLQPPLTTVNQPVYQIARQLVQMLVVILAGGVWVEKHVQIQPVLEIRASTTSQVATA
jgi:LacI family transcriptional regulator, galactose operon repressor